MPTRNNSIHLFRLFGIDVYLNWLWLLAAGYIIWQYKSEDNSPWILSVLLCLSLYLIVLVHEFGHQLACRQVGGKTHDIVLGPLGGVAYVSPPERPGPQLWSIAAGPLVNVVLVVLLSVLWSASYHLGFYDSHPDIYDFCHGVWQINLGLLIFNMLPIYPLDGGQILRSLLWFVIGRAKSLLVVSIIGFIGVAGVIVLAVLLHSLWLGFITVFILMSCWRGLKHALALGRIAKLPRRPEFTCPDCKNSPPLGNYWRCNKCGTQFDLFETMGKCPGCLAQFSQSHCLDCGTLHFLNEWAGSPPPPPPL